MAKALANKWIILVILALTWGSVFILIKKALLVFNPFEIGALRMGISGIALLYFGIPAIRKMDKRTFLWVSTVGLVGNFVPAFLFPIAQTQVSSSIAGILDSLVPVFVLVLGFIFFGIRSQFTQFIGAFVGFAGAAFLMWLSESHTEETQVGYAMLVVLATALYALSALIIKTKLAHVPSLELSSSAITIWMLPSFAALYFAGFYTNFEATPKTWEALGYLSILAILGTAICGFLYFKLIQDVSPVFASTVTYFLPVVAVIWGLIDGEQFTFWYLIGGLLILIGIYLIREKKKKPEHIPR